VIRATSINLQNFTTARIGSHKINNTRPRPVKVTFLSMEERNSVWRARRRFAGTQFAVAEDLPISMRIARAIKEKSKVNVDIDREPHDSHPPYAPADTKSDPPKSISDNDPSDCESVDSSVPPPWYNSFARVLRPDFQAFEESIRAIFHQTSPPQ